MFPCVTLLIFGTESFEYLHNRFTWEFIFLNIKALLSSMKMNAYSEEINDFRRLC